MRTRYEVLKVFQSQHNFISLDFLGSIHARGVRIGRTSEFLLDQFKTCTNLATIPLWIAGLYFYFRTPAGKRYCADQLFLVGCGERYERRSERRNRLARIGADRGADSRWPPTADRAQLGILAGNYGEAGAINLYGPAYNLATAISGINSYWPRGYGDPPPQTLIVLGLTPAQANQIFRACEIVGRITNQYVVKNEETAEHPTILVCRELQSTWPEFWKHFKYYG